MGTARVKLLGEEITLKGPEDSGYLERLAADVDLLLKRVSAELSLQSQPTRVALLVAINLMDELTKLKEKHALLATGTSTAAEQMVKRIEHTLSVEQSETA